MKIIYKDNFDLLPLVQKLNNSRIVKNGKAEFSGFELEEIVPIISTNMHCNKVIPDESKIPLIREGIFEAAKNEITIDSLNNYISKTVKKYLEKRPEKFYLTTNLSISKSIELPKFVINSSHITFRSDRISKEQKEREPIIEQLSTYLFRQYPDHYLNVRVSTEGKSEFEAVNMALDNLDFLRGQWNFLLNSSFAVSFFASGRKRPINKIVLGPLHTLHKMDSSCIKTFYWYEPYYHEKSQVFENAEKFDKIKPYMDRMRKRLNRLQPSYREKLTSSLIRYVRALDIYDYEVAFVRLWGVLELVTGTVKGNNTITVRRAAFVWDEPDYHACVLEHLKDIRNENIHAGRSIQERETCLYQLKRYVEQILRFHIWNDIGFDSFESAVEFLDFSQSVKILVEKKSFLEAAIKYKSKKV